jgi:DNA-binding CsgD family transcriptional regulator
MAVLERDLTALMRLVNDGRDDADGGAHVPLPTSVLAGLTNVIACDMVSVSLLDSRAERVDEQQDLPDDPNEVDPVKADLMSKVFFGHYWDTAPCSYPDRTGDLDRVVRVSDFYTVRQFRNTAMYSEYARPFERELIACLGGSPGRTLRVVLSRGPGADFSERDRTALWLVRPHLYRLYRERRNARTGAVDLTDRQRELLSLVAVGHTNRQISRRLEISETTVRKHLEHIFERLRVQNRAAAVARAFPHGMPDA